MEIIINKWDELKLINRNVMNAGHEINEMNWTIIIWNKWKQHWR